MGLWFDSVLQEYFELGILVPLAFII